MADIFHFSADSAESMAFLGNFFSSFIENALTMAFFVVSYILTAIGLCAIAKRRGIPNPWLSWVPVASFWILGKISDHYQKEVKGNITNRTKTMLWLTIASYGLLMITFTIILVAVVFAIISTEAVPVMVIMLVLVITSLCAALGLAIALAVIQYKATFDLFRSCKPDKAVLFLVLSILFSYPMAFFIFACRNDDLGMPPKPEQLPPVQSWQ